jgi:hypothetical protein
MNLCRIWGSRSCRYECSHLLGFKPMHHLPSHLPYADFLIGWFRTVKMEGIRSFETSVHIWTSQRCIPEDGNSDVNLWVPYIKDRICYSKLIPCLMWLGGVSSYFLPTFSTQLGKFWNMILLAEHHNTVPRTSPEVFLDLILFDDPVEEWSWSGVRRDVLECFRKHLRVRFEVFTAVTMKNDVFWDVTPCGSCKNRRFGET